VIESTNGIDGARLPTPPTPAADGDDAVGGDANESSPPLAPALRRRRGGWSAGATRNAVECGLVVVVVVVVVVGGVAESTRSSSWKMPESADLVESSSIDVDDIVDESWGIF
jgi:hypothetical protein